MEASAIYCPGAGCGLPAAAFLNWLVQMCGRQRPDLLLFYDDTAGHELASRLCARLGCGLFTDAVSAARRGERLFLARKACGSHLDWRIEVNRFPFVASISRGRAKAPTLALPVPVGEAPPLRPPEAGWLISRNELESRRENQLETARLLFVGGRGLGSKDGCEQMRRIAALYGAVPGFTRAAAMNGWCRMDEIIGQSGVRAAPEICVALGVSGAAAFMAGVEGAGVLVAINTDPDAPIFRRANAGAVVDALAFMEELEVAASEGD
jgi:electron transfer flavoprotein alpha subunit